MKCLFNINVIKLFVCISCSRHVNALKETIDYRLQYKRCDVIALIP